MKKITLILFLLASVGISSDAYSNINNGVVKVMYVCDTIAKENSTDCGVYNSAALEVFAASILAPPVSFECQQNPNDPTCDSSNSTSSVTEVQFLIVDADNSVASQYSAVRTPFGTVSFTQLTLDATAQNLANDVYALEQQLMLAQTEYSFTAKPNIGFTNGNNQTLTSYLTPSTIQAVESNNNDPIDVTACPSAIAYRTNQECSSLINNLILGESQKAATVMNTVQDILARLNASITVGPFQIGAPLEGEFDIDFNFDDGSKLVIDIEPGSNVSINPNYDASVTSGGDRTLSEYFALADSNNIVGNEIYSGDEARALFRGIPQCRNTSVLIGRDKEYLVTVVEYPNGTKRISSIQVLSSKPIFDSRIVCDYGISIP